MKTLDYQKIVREAVRFYPPICALFMLHHVVALIAGYDLCIHDWIVDSSLVSFVMQWLLSRAFRFCAWHRACIIYTYVVSLCADYQRDYDFGPMLGILRWTVLMAGVVVLVAFVAKCIRNNNT